MADASDLEIVRLGSHGDGVANRDGEPVFVPLALPGERWRVSDDAAPMLVRPGGERQTPPCRHFTRCGGCVAQHMSDELYRKWKHGIVVDAFRHRGIDVEVRPLRRVAANSRRRAFLGVERQGRTVTIGFRQEGQHTLVDLAECIVLDPAIVGAVEVLRDMARIAMRDREGGRLVVTRLDHGLDISFDNGRKDLPPADRAELARLASTIRTVRLVVGGELIVQSGRVTLTVGGVEVEPPPGIFLQAVPEAEGHLVELIREGLPRRAKMVADLFSGVGTFAFPLARQAQVGAYDSDRRAIDALKAALRHAQGLKPIDARVRDLFRDPLSARELDHFDAVVFDPPRAGAAAQAERIAKSQVQTVIAVSCNPATLARDSRTLIDGGYAIGAVTPIDQFLYSPHVEAVVVFRR